ncbi:MAG: hypothetical protein QNI97_18720, partial [Desulfobacterales bacterium]|nr:hypothetical protein [Desulfobacterales bacterium]
PKTGTMSFQETWSDDPYCTRPYGDIVPKWLSNNKPRLVELTAAATFFNIWRSDSAIALPSFV